MTVIYIIFIHKKNLDVPQQMIGYRKWGVFEEWNITQTLKNEIIKLADKSVEIETNILC